ncbi:MAG: NAD(P)H-dependent glycerol-3-phosphate dehydrogenase [Pseudomonadales bacterium]
MRIAVLGGGSFGTIIANIAAQKETHVVQWMRCAQRAQEINQLHTNQQYLPGCQLEPNLVATCDMQAAVEQADLIFVSIPSAHFRSVIAQASMYIRKGAYIVSTTKGIEESTFNLMSQILQEEVPQAEVGVISGPNLAKELAQQQLTATVIASQHKGLRDCVQNLLHLPYFRLYASDDMYGVELGGTLKNIYAIASGLSSALGVGENTKSMLMTRALAEMSRFAVSMGANPLTFLGLAGVGDLIVTCMSPLSRNYRVGYAIGRGRSLKKAIAELGEVAEGVNTLRIVREKMIELDIYMPLVQGLYDVVYQGASVSEVANTLMMSDQGADVEFVLPSPQNF